MSLTSYLRTNAEARQQVSAALHKGRRAVAAVPIRAEPLGPRHGLVGTAFDYLLRSLLIRAHAGRTLVHGGSPCLALQTVPDFLGDDTRLGQLWDAHQIRVAFEAGQRDLTPEVARACLTLATFDVTYRVSGYHHLAGVVHGEDVQDLLNLAATVPLESFRAERRLLLNPLFGAGARVGGADADLLIDGTLIDVKTSLHLKARSEYLQQLSGYLALARLGGVHGAGAEPIERLGVYFARHGLLHVWTLEDLYAPGQLDALTAWFDQDWWAIPLDPARPAQARVVGRREPGEDPWTVVRGYQALPGPDAQGAARLTLWQRHRGTPHAIRSTLIARRPARALLGESADEADVWVVAALLGACPATAAPLTFLDEHLQDLTAVQRILSASKHTDAWWTGQQDDLPARVRRVARRVRRTLDTPLDPAAAEVLAQLLPCPAPLEDHVPVTRAAQAAVRALVAGGRVLKDGRLVQRLDAAQRCVVASGA